MFLVFSFELLNLLTKITAIIMIEGHQGRRIIKSASVRTRFTPTFFHHDIFGTGDLAESHVRVTPTFESTVFNCDGYHIQTNHSRTLRTKEEHHAQPQPHIYFNQSRERKQAFLNPFSGYCQDYRTSRCSDDKERLAEDINHMHGRTSRLRKCVEQMSNPIFGGCTWTPFAPVQQVQPYDASAYHHKVTFAKEAHPEKQPVSKQAQAEQPTQEAKPPRQTVKPQAAKKPTADPARAANKSSSKHTNNLKKFKSAANLRVPK